MPSKKQAAEKVSPQLDAAAPLAASEAKPAARTDPGRSQAHAVPETASSALAFETAGQRYALPVENVVQIIEMVTITPLPAAPHIVVGVINFHGQVIPVVDMRRRLQAPPQPYSLRTPIVVGELHGHKVGLVVDAVSGVLQLNPAQIDTPSRIFTREMVLKTNHLTGIARTDDGMLLLLDPDSFLSAKEAAQLAAAIMDS